MKFLLLYAILWLHFYYEKKVHIQFEWWNKYFAVFAGWVHGSLWLTCHTRVFLLTWCGVCCGFCIIQTEVRSARLLPSVAGHGPSLRNTSGTLEVSSWPKTCLNYNRRGSKGRDPCCVWDRFIRAWYWEGKIECRIGKCLRKPGPTC